MEVYYSGRDHGTVEEYELGPTVRAQLPSRPQSQVCSSKCFFSSLCAHLKMSSQTMEGKEAALTSIETKWQKIGAQVSRTLEMQNLQKKLHI